MANPFPGLVKPKAPRKARARRPVNPATFIGQSRGVSSEQKAIWHNVTGAGRRGVIRRFFDLNASDEAALRDGLERSVEMRLRAANQP